MKPNTRLPQTCMVTLWSCACLQLAWALPIPGLYNTGVDETGALLGPNAVDPHYQLIASDDPGYPGPDVYTLAPGFPVGPWLAEGPDSRWIAPRAEQSIGNAEGDYTYRTTFDLTDLDPSTARIIGSWAVDNTGVDIVLNGASLGIRNNAGFTSWSNFTIESGFVAGINTLDFIVYNLPDTPNPTGLRVRMIGLVEVPDEAPRFLTQPAGGSFVEGETVSLSVWADGTSPLSYQWKRNGQDLPGQTEATLTLPSITPAQEGDYTVLVSNPVGETLSEPAAIEVFNRIPGLFNTGVRDDGSLLWDGDMDMHYVLIVNPQPDPYPEPMVQNSLAFPIVDGPWVANSETSKWIGPEFDTSAAAAGEYVYEMEINLAGFDPTTAFITGRWATDDDADLFLNGLATGIVNAGNFGTLTPFRLDTGFLSGINKLHFKVRNTAFGYTGLRVEDLRGGARVGTAVDDPRIVTEPVGGLVISGQSLSLSVLTDGTQPISYQWERNGAALPGMTTSTLVLSDITLADAGNYTVLVSNARGSIRSAVAVLTVLERVPGVFNTGVDAAGAVLPDGEIDPHYQLVASADAEYPGPNAAVVNDDWPIAPAGPWVANSLDSKWIAPRAEQGIGNAPGQYRFRTTFDLTGFDPSTAKMFGRWSVDDGGLDIFLNGSSLGIPTTTGFDGWSEFTVESGFVAGVNTLDFIANNGGTDINPTGLRVDNLRIGALPGVAEPPTLSIERIGHDLRIAWPAAHTGFTLRFSDALPASVWNELDVPIIVDGDQNAATVPIESNTRFFRLNQ